MEARLGFDYYINGGRTSNGTLSSLVGKHLSQLTEERTRHSAEQIPHRNRIRQEFSSELAKVANKSRVAEFKKLSKDFLLEHARLENKPSLMPQYITKVRESLIQEQRSIASRLGLDLEHAARIRRDFAERMSRNVLADSAVPVGNFLSPDDLHQFPHLLKRPGSNPDVSVYEAPFDGWRYAWWYNIYGVNPNVSNLDHWSDQATGFTGSQISFYIGTDESNDNHFDGENNSEVAIVHQMNRAGRIRVIALIQCVQDTQWSRTIDESGIFGVPGLFFDNSAHVFNLDITLDSGNLNVGKGVIRDSFADDPVPLQVQTFGFDVPITFSSGQEVVLWMGTGAQVHCWGDDVQIFYSTLQQWQLQGVIVVTV
jgi:hypothetical protein